MRSYSDALRAFLRVRTPQQGATEPKQDIARTVERLRTQAR